jgi:hypothetical protein
VQQRRRRWRPPTRASWLSWVRIAAFQNGIYRFKTGLRYHFAAQSACVLCLFIQCTHVEAIRIAGSGAQARSHIELLDRVHKYKEVRVWSRTQANASSLVDECTKKYGEQTRFCTTETGTLSVFDSKYCRPQEWGLLAYHVGPVSPVSNNRFKTILPAAEMAVRDADVVCLCTSSKVCTGMRV